MMVGRCHNCDHMDLHCRMRADTNHNHDHSGKCRNSLVKRPGVGFGIGYGVGLAILIGHCGFSFSDTKMI